MQHISARRFQRGDHVALRADHGSLPAGARGVVIETHWVMQMCTVDFEGEAVATLPCRLLARPDECARAVGAADIGR